MTPTCSTTKEDIDLVKGMVGNYIKESRTIILAATPCTGDIANQKILTVANMFHDKRRH